MLRHIYQVKKGGKSRIDNVLNMMFCFMAMDKAGYQKNDGYRLVGSNYFLDFDRKIKR